MNVKATAEMERGEKGKPREETRKGGGRSEGRHSYRTEKRHRAVIATATQEMKS